LPGQPYSLEMVTTGPSNSCLETESKYLSVKYLDISIRMAEQGFEKFSYL
jgi:hypothetical protein